MPNLVETVKGYAKHEKKTLEAGTTARNMVTGSNGMADLQAVENESCRCPQYKDHPD